MRADQIQSRAVAKVVLVALFWTAVAVLLAIAILHTRTTLQWVAAAIFLALGARPRRRADPAGLAARRPDAARCWRSCSSTCSPWRLLVFLILHVFPPIVHDIEGLGHKLPGYVHDFENWANNNQQFQDLNAKYHITPKLTQEASTLPSHLSSGASTLGSLTVSLLEHLLAAITVITLTFFLLLEGRGMVERGTGPAARASSATGARRIAERVAEVVKAYVSVNLLLAIAAGCPDLGRFSKRTASTSPCRWRCWSPSST